MARDHNAVLESFEAHPKARDWHGVPAVQIRGPDEVLLGISYECRPAVEQTIDVLEKRRKRR